MDREDLDFALEPWKPILARSDAAARRPFCMDRRDLEFAI